MAQSPRRSSSHGKMKILRKLGSGKTGTVYVVRINNVERALKVVRIPLSLPCDTYQLN